jgi:hypothetical protein
MNNSEASDDIISVMRNIVAQFQTKTPAVDNEGIDVALSVRLWKISGFHEMLASLGFDLMDVGQDQVTLRTGKQANKRNCQFVLQSLLALFTQEAPKTIGMESASNSSSSTESLNEIVDSDIKSQNQRRDQGGSAYFPRPIIAPRKMTTSSRSAFISYQKRRGEPDGGHEDAVQQQKLQPTFENTDSELSDGYATQKMIAKYTGKDLSGFGGMRGTTKICRPGGGGESDATFTPSPIDNNVSMALAHQTRIRNLYTNISEATSSGVPGMNGMRRPDSSSSASSATDWDSGHATVLRRANNAAMQGATLPMPATRQLLPIVDNLRPTAPVYNNLLVQCGMKKNLGMIESASSDSEGWIPSQTRNKIKLHQQYIQQAHQQQHQANSHYQDIPAVSVAKLKEQFNFIDRLSVRTEASKANGGHRKSILKPNDDLNMPGNSLYFSPAELQNTTTNLVEDDSGPSSVIHHPPTHNHHKSKETKANGNSSTAAASNASNPQPTKKNIQDSIMRHMNREMAPAIYHERNIGLIAAPPLSKLLMTNYEENEPVIAALPPATSSSPTSGLNKLMNAIDLSEEITNCTSSTAKLLSCGGASNSDDEFSVEDEAASSQTTMKSAPKKKSFSSVPWLSSLNTENIVKPSDLTTAEILEHQKVKSTSSSSSNSDHLSVVKSPYSEFRDDADGHSQCSSTPKNSLPSQQIRNNIY